jgi:integrase
MARTHGSARGRRGVRKARADNGEGSVYRAGNYWKAALIIDGKRRYRNATTEELAYAKLDELKLLRDQGELSFTKTQSLALYCAQWLKDTKSPPFTRPHTYWVYTSRLRHVVDALGHLPLRDITPSHIAHLHADLLRVGFKPGTVQGIHMLLRAALDDAVRHEILDRNPAAPVKSPAAQPADFTTLTRDELAMLLNSTQGTRWHALWSVLSTSGMRSGEARALTWDETREGVAKIRRTATSGQGQRLFAGPVKTKSSRRDIPLSRTAVTALARHRVIQAEERLASDRWLDKGLVFPNLSGDYLQQSTIRDRFLHDLTSAGLPAMRLHDLRHTAATLMLEAGQQPHTVQRTLGHSNIAMTLGLYGHVTGTMLQSAADAMDRMLEDVK